MTVIKYQGREYLRESQQSVLDCLLSHGVNIPHACRSGVCCSCLMRSSTREIPVSAQSGLKDSLKSQGYFLACMCRPEGNLEISDPDSALQIQGEIQKLDLLNDEVLRLQIKIPESFIFKAGQYISLIRGDGLTRSYSIASLPETGYLELHVRLIPNGKMSSWIKTSLQVGDKISIRGPSGNCFFSGGKSEQPLLLAGTGTGLAPLYGILNDAIRQGHSGPIWLFHGGRNPFSLYLKDELEQLSLRYPQFHYRPCVLSEGTESVPAIPLDQNIMKHFPWIKTARIYLCGDPVLVNGLRKKMFLAGASSKEIYADAFLPSLA